MNNKELKTLAEIFGEVENNYPNWYGIDGIKFIWHGEWNDPELEFDGMRVNSTIIEDTMWSFYKEEYPQGNEEDFDKYMIDNADEAKWLINVALGLAD